MCVRASLENVGIFTFLNCYFFQYFVGIYNRYFLSTNGMLVGLHVPTNFQIYRQTLTLSKCMCMQRASLENVGIFTFLNCYFFQYFVGTADTLSVQMTCTDKFPNIGLPTNSNIEQMYVYASERSERA